MKQIPDAFIPIEFVKLGAALGGLLHATKYPRLTHTRRFEDFAVALFGATSGERGQPPSLSQKLPRRPSPAIFA